MPSAFFLAAAEKASGLQFVWEFLSTGGFVMGLLVLCSMAAITAMMAARTVTDPGRVVVGLSATYIPFMARYCLG